MKLKPEKLLAAILAQIPQDGWTKSAFDRGIKSCSTSAAEAQKLFPRGISDIAVTFHASIDEAMQAKIKSKRNFSAMRVRDKITYAVRARLEAIEPHREAMRRLLVWSLLPRNIGAAAKQLWQSADSIWNAAGDASTDYNYYTKRMLLIAVMKSVLSFWLNDASASYQDTWAFLDRRIADVMKVGKGLSVVKTVGMSDILSFVKSRFAA